MKAQVLTGIGQMEMRQVDDPVISRDTDVLLRIEMVGVCGSTPTSSGMNARLPSRPSEARSNG